MHIVLKQMAVGLIGGVVGAAGTRAATHTAAPHAFLVAEINVHDTVSYPTYAKGAALAVAQYGGHYLARGGATHTIEGAAPPNRVALVEFPNMDDLLRFEASPEYGAVRPIRQRAAESRIFAVQGVTP
jgi:uncharacterized protein (DUF1330 family)